MKVVVFLADLDMVSCVATQFNMFCHTTPSRAKIARKTAKRGLTTNEITTIIAVVILFQNNGVIMTPRNYHRKNQPFHHKNQHSNK
jgi:hypothetical protein